MSTASEIAPPPETTAPASDVYAFPATPQQQQLWFLDSLYLGNPSYNIPLAYELRGPVDYNALNRSFAWVVSRHENLRTTFALRGDEFVQVVEATVDIKLQHLDLGTLPAEARDAECRRVVAEEAAHKFNLARGPLARGMVIRLEEKRHILSFNFHHIILDHLSVLQFAREFCSAYDAYREGNEPDAEAPAFQYPDFSIWQNEQFEEQSFKAQLNEWIAQLEGSPVETPLPFDRPRGAAQTFAGREVKFTLPLELSNRVRDLARSSKKSVFVTLLTAFKVLLARYSGQSDIIVGSPFSNRTVASLENVMGCCMNTLPLRTQLPATATFQETLGQVHQTVLHAYQRQRVPLKLIVDHAKLERDASRNPLFQSTFIVQDPPMAISLTGLEVVPLNIHNDTSKFDMAVWMWDVAGAPLAGVWEYNTDLFDAGTIERMIRNFETLLASAAAAPMRSWRELVLLSPEEAQLLVRKFNQTEMDYPRTATVVNLVEATVRRVPEAVALIYGDRKMTYRELWDGSTRLAGELVARGVRPGALVGIYVERSLEMVVSMLAIVRAGAAYVPLDPAFPADRVKFMIEDSGIKLILTQTTLVEHMPAHSAQTLLVDRPAPAGNAATLPAAIDAQSLAYVRFTSGSTGKPKGVEIPHQALVNFLLSMRKEPGLVEGDRLLAVTTLSFDISELEIWLPLVTGAQAILASRTQAADGAELRALLQRHRITVMQATPSTWRLLLEAGWVGDANLKILCGGEALPVELAQRLVDKCAALWNMYGPTETTVWSSAWKVPADHPIRVGPPIANTQFFILDSALHPVPLGVHGELLIGGDGLARGYWQRPELTQDRFISSPFESSARLYRTGDLVRYRPDGTLEFLGRIDNQVKLRGYRIELGEIEAALVDIAGITQAVAAVRDEQLVAYYVGSGAEPLDPATCREALRARLPDYMVPALFVKLEKFPLTPNGKVDRKALPPPGGMATAATAEYRAARNETEKQLVAIWEQVLKRSPIGIDDNFFDLGGHSLLAVTLFGKVETVFGRRLPLASLFQNPNVARLATLLTNDAPAATTWRSLVTIREGGNGPAMFIVHGAGGNILIYRSLAEHLTPGVPVYGLQSLGLDGHTAPLRTIEEMAASYVEEIVQKQPAGPYNLAGYCMGGKVAFEIARILKEQGREVKLVALLDSYNFEEAIRVSKLSLYAQMVGFHLRNIFELNPIEATGYLKEKFRMFVEAVTTTAGASADRVKRRLAGEKDDAAVENLIQKVNDTAGEIYVPKPYEGKVTLFKPHRNYSTFKDPNMGWRNVTKGELEMVRLELNPHAMLVEPYVRKLAEALNARLS